MGCLDSFPHTPLWSFLLQCQPQTPWIQLDALWVTDLQHCFGFDWIGFDWIGLDWIGFDCNPQCLIGTLPGSREYVCHDRVWSKRFGSEFKENGLCTSCLCKCILPRDQGNFTTCKNFGSSIYNHREGGGHQCNTWAICRWSLASPYADNGSGLQEKCLPRFEVIP